MAQKITMLKIFVASPSDVSEERQRLRKVIEELNHGMAQANGLVLQFMGWETDAWPGFGNDAQDVINREIGPYDIFIGIMWNRFGTPTHRSGSGTEEEFERAYDLWSKYKRPTIMLYFGVAPVSVMHLDQAEQLAKVLGFKKKASEKGALLWDYNGPDDFERLARQHLIKEILNWKDVSTPDVIHTRVRFPLQFYQTLFNELDIYITQFNQLLRDYDREMQGKKLVFAVDFSELHNYMYPYSPDSPRSTINQYVFKTLENRSFTLMPGALGELLTDLERALPSSDVLDKDPLCEYANVAKFINEFPVALNDEERVLELYGPAEKDLRRAWGELLDVVLKGIEHTAFHAIKTLIDDDKISPIEGVQNIIPPLSEELRQKAQWVRKDLNFSRPLRIRNNQVDTVDFIVTWLLNNSNHDASHRQRYISIYTQSKAFMNACTARRELRWEDDYLVRGAQYLKYRARLQELFTTIDLRRSFVLEWISKCKDLQNGITNLIDFERELPKITEPSQILLDHYREFDEECRIPLEFTGDLGKQERINTNARARELYELLKQNGEYRGKTGEAFEVLKVYLQGLNKDLSLFTPDGNTQQEAYKYVRKIINWLEI